MSTGFVMVTTPSSILSSLFASFEGLWIARFVFASTISLQCYEFVTTIDQEYHLFWARKRQITVTQVLFVLNRYFPFVTGSFLIAAYVTGDPSAKRFCSHTMVVSSLLCTFQFSIAYYVLALRAYAVWECRKFILLLILVVNLPSTAYAFYFAYVYGHPITSLDFKLLSPGCVVIASGSLVKALAVIVSAEVFSLALLVSKALWFAYKWPEGRKLNSMPSLFRTLVRDGILYFICIIASTVANILVNFTTHGVLHPVFFPFQATIQNILCVRLLLHIREANYRQENGSESARSGAISRGLQNNGGIRPRLGNGNTRSYIVFGPLDVRGSMEVTSSTSLP